jgi:hypothetical protein
MLIRTDYKLTDMGWRLIEALHVTVEDFAFKIFNQDKNDKVKILINLVDETVDEFYTTRTKELREQDSVVAIVHGVLDENKWHLQSLAFGDYFVMTRCIITENGYRMEYNFDY